MRLYLMTLLSVLSSSKVCWSTLLVVVLENRVTWSTVACLTAGVLDEKHVDV
jgi:hypothetical protein